MNKKKLLIVFSSLFLISLFLIVIIFYNNSNTKIDKSKGKINHINTSQIQEKTSYNHNDTDGDYEKMLKAAEEQDKLANLEKEKKLLEEQNKKEEKEKNKNENKTTTTKENGISYITNSSGIMIPKGSVGTKPVKNKKLPASENYKNEKPFYAKYGEDIPKSTQNKKTKETKLLHKYLKDNNIIIVNNDVDLKGDGTAIAYQKNNKGGIKTALVTILNQAGTAKKEHANNLHYTVNFNEKYIDKHTDISFKIVKSLGMPISKSEFYNLYKKYKYGKLSDNDYKKPYKIGYNGMEVALEW